MLPLRFPNTKIKIGWWDLGLTPLNLKLVGTRALKTPGKLRKKLSTPSVLRNVTPTFRVTGYEAVLPHIYRKAIGVEDRWDR
ncbi:hypothetical protein B296_00010809 [Ensete ventricosum]|uniref:Uncharacterized protein n=1 Tax=Ensete ventricosum TaxID=4639 RepID=A0A426ZFC8_ENSVE|nr:hypothetical protein B296_00010809 [Ensete ventricosum]